MPRIRTIKPDFFFDEHLTELPFEARLTFIGLWCYADKAGILEDSPKKLKAVLFPYEEIDMEAILSDLSKKPFITRYEIGGKNYIQVVNFHRHQVVHHTERESILPTPNGEVTVKQPLLARENKVGKERKGREGNVQLTDEQFLNGLKANPAFKDIDLALELGRMDAWLLAHPGRKKTRRFITAWLNRIDKPMDIKPLGSNEGAYGRDLNEKFSNK